MNQAKELYDGSLGLALSANMEELSRNSFKQLRELFKVKVEQVFLTDEKFIKKQLKRSRVGIE